MTEMENVEPGKNEADPAASPVTPYKVGYRCPPLHTRFAKKRSGNVNGRPKDVRDVKKILDAFCGEKITVNENGKRKKITKLKAALKHVVNRAAVGDFKALQLMLTLQQATEPKAGANEPERADETDEAIMASLARRLGGGENGGTLQ